MTPTHGRNASKYASAGVESTNCLPFLEKFMTLQLANAPPPPFLVEETRQTVSADTYRNIVLESDRPVLLHCISGWAAPCRAQHGVIESLAAECDGRFTFAVLDVHMEEELAALLLVRALPTLLLFSNGRLIERFVGFQNGPRLKSALIAAEMPVTSVRLAS